MESKNNKLPKYFLGKYQLIATVTFLAFFSLLFLLISIPFSHNAWFGLGASQAFSYTLAFYTIGLCVIIISKRLMYWTRNIFEMTYLEYVLWDLAEVIVICILYTIFSVKGDKSGLIHLAQPPIEIFFSSMSYAFGSMVIPYIIAGMYFAIIDKNNTIRLLNYNEIVSDEDIDPINGKKITLFDNNGDLKLSVSSNNLLYIESDDNYIKVWYLDHKGDLQTYMIRCRLKTIEESFMGSNLVRCHRQYIVNMDKVRVLRKEKDGYELELDNDSISTIPISKTYAANVLDIFNGKQLK